MENNRKMQSPTSQLSHQNQQ